MTSQAKLPRGQRLALKRLAKDPLERNRAGWGSFPYVSGNSVRALARGGLAKLDSRGRRAEITPRGRAVLESL